MGAKLPTNTGHIVIRTEAGWELEHRVIWREHNGPIPPGAMIKHRNGNSTDNKLENLVLVGGKLGVTRKTKRGYVIIRTANGWEYEHRFVWSKHHGSIPDGAIVHHRNGIKSDNRIENLEVVRSSSEHMRRYHGHVSRSRVCSPETRAKMSASAKRRAEDPARRAQLSENGKRGAEKRWHQR